MLNNEYEEYMLDEAQYIHKKKLRESKLYKELHLVKDVTRRDSKSIKIESERLIKKCFATNPEVFVNDTFTMSHILSFLIMVALPFAFNPIIGLIGYITRAICIQNVDASVMNRNIIMYKNKIKKVEKQIQKARGHEKDLLNGVKFKLEDGVSAMEDYRDKINNNLREQESGDNMIHDSHEYDNLLESLTNELEYKLAHHYGENLNESIKSKLSTVKAKAKVTSKRVDEKVDKNADALVKGFKNTMTGGEVSREEVLKGKRDLNSLIKRAILSGTAYLINPALGAVTALTAYGLSVKSSNQEKKKIIAELKEEYEIVEDKIRDADSRGDNKKKYELMRIRNKIGRDLDKLRYHIKRKDD